MNKIIRTFLLSMLIFYCAIAQSEQPSRQQDGIFIQKNKNLVIKDLKFNPWKKKTILPGGGGCQIVKSFSVPAGGGGYRDAEGHLRQGVTDVTDTTRGHMGFGLHSDKGDFGYDALCQLDLPHGAKIKEIKLIGRITQGSSSIYAWLMQLDRSQMTELHRFDVSQYRRELVRVGLTGDTNRTVASVSPNVALDTNKYMYMIQVGAYKNRNTRYYDVFLSAIDILYDAD